VLEERIRAVEEDMNAYYNKPTEDIIYVETRSEVTFFGNTDKGCRWLRNNTANVPHTIQREHLEDFLSTLSEYELTYERSYRVPEL
jgi:hypothetical protein